MSLALPEIVYLQSHRSRLLFTTFWINHIWTGERFSPCCSLHCSLVPTQLQWNCSNRFQTGPVKKFTCTCFSKWTQEKLRSQKDQRHFFKAPSTGLAKKVPLGFPWRVTESHEETFPANLRVLWEWQGMVNSMGVSGITGLLCYRAPQLMCDSGDRMASLKF